MLILSSDAGRCWDLARSMRDVEDLRGKND